VLRRRPRCSATGALIDGELGAVGGATLTPSPSSYEPDTTTDPAFASTGSM
jgi:hypothetical protein